VDTWAVAALTEMYDDVQHHLKSLGYAEVIIDQEGFTSGKLNREIIRHEK